MTKFRSWIGVELFVRINVWNPKYYFIMKCNILFFKRYDILDLHYFVLEYCLRNFKENKTLRMIMKYYCPHINMTPITKRILNSQRKVNQNTTEDIRHISHTRVRTNYWHCQQWHLNLICARSIPKLKQNSSY